MQKLKKAGLLLLALCLALTLLTGCGGKTEESAPAPSETSQEESLQQEQPEEEDKDAEEGWNSGYSDGLDENGYFLGVTALDYVTLPDYKNMALPEGVGDVSEEDLEESVQALLEENLVSQMIYDRAVEDGDTVMIDYVGSVDGVEFEGGSTGGQGTTVTIGVTSYIDDFLEQLIGHMPGDTFDVEVTFPDPYTNNTDLSGKDAVFVTTVNYILEDKVPELTDDFVAGTFGESNGWATVEDLREGLRARLRKDAIHKWLWNEINEQTVISSVPEVFVKYNENTLVNYYTSMADQYGMELDDFLTTYVQVNDIHQILEENRDTIETNARNSLVLQALSEDMGFTVSDEMLKNYLQDLIGGDDLSGLETYYGRPYLSLIARETLVMDELTDKY